MIPSSTTLPTEIPKFVGKPREDPIAHIITYHLWYSSNSFVDDSIHLRLFQRTLINSVAIWYINLESVAYYNFLSFV